MSKPTLSRLFLSLVCLTVINFSSLFAGVIYDKNFQGEEQEVGIVLTWSTSSEEDNSLFVIEKATDGEDFESIGAVGGTGDSDVLTEYNFFDFNVHGTYILYRLKQLDEDGTVNYSKPLFINKVNENNFMVARMSDVMTTGKFEVTFDMMIDSNMEYHLTNARGETVVKENMDFKKGINDIVIGMEDAESGTYKLSLRVDDEEEIITFKKIKSEAQKNKAVTAKKD